MNGWMSDAKCVEVSPHLFFPEHGDMSTAALAKAICAECPVMVVCGEYAKTNHIRYGIFGGTGPRARNAA